MLSMLNDGGQKQLSTRLNNTATTACSPISFDQSKTYQNVSLPAAPLTSPKRSSSGKMGRRPPQRVNISDSEDSHDVQEERRQEFERFRQQKKQKRITNQQQHQVLVQVPPPQFAIGHPASSDRISALFPKVSEETDGGLTGTGKNGRHVATADGDQVFIPKLNLDDQWSIDSVKTPENVKSFDFHAPENDDEEIVVQTVDRGCQTLRIRENPENPENPPGKQVVVMKCCLHEQFKEKNKKRKKEVIWLLLFLRYNQLLLVFPIPIPIPLNFWRYYRY
jgi:hypothetical protein